MLIQMCLPSVGAEITWCVRRSWSYTGSLFMHLAAFFSSLLK